MRSCFRWEADFDMAKDSNSLVNKLLPVLSSPLPPKEDDPYFAALGRFVVSYASAEHEVHGLARRLSRVTDAKGRVIFRGMRLGDLTDRIRGLLEVTKASIRIHDEVDACLRQLGNIADERNKLVHRLVLYRKQHILVTNLPIAKSTASAEIETFTLSELESMDLDCLAIRLRLGRVHNRKSRPNLNREMVEWIHRPWRYTPSPPNPQKEGDRPKAPKRKNPPDASRR